MYELIGVTIEEIKEELKRRDQEGWEDYEYLFKYKKGFLIELLKYKIETKIKNG